MVDLLQLHKYFLGAHIRPGDTVADFTMGNGHDTQYLSQAVGPDGHVYAFDIQAQAVESTKKRLQENNCPKNYTLILDSHANAGKYLPETIRAGVFNLGWLPGADKSVTTRRESTLTAVQCALEHLDHGGILLIAVYPGHPEGALEGNMLDEYFRSLSRFQMSVSRFEIINSPASPFFFAIEKK